MKTLLISCAAALLLTLTACGDTCYQCQTTLDNDSTEIVVDTREICDQDENTALNIKQGYEVDNSNGDSTATCALDK